MEGRKVKRESKGKEDNQTPNIEKEQRNPKINIILNTNDSTTGRMEAEENGRKAKGR